MTPDQEAEFMFNYLFMWLGVPSIIIGVIGFFTLAAVLLANFLTKPRRKS